MPTDLYKQYQESAITQADPLKLVVLMYEGALRFTRVARKAIEDHDPEAAHNNILRAYAIVAELMATLDFEGGGEIAIRLEQCYEYTLHLLKEADIQKDAKLLDQVLEMLEPLVETWQEAFRNGPPPAAASGEAGQDTPAAEESGEPPQEEPAEDDEQSPSGRRSLDVVG